MGTILPSEAEHEFDWNRVDLNTAYVPPLSGAYSYEYDRDRRLAKVVYPSTSEVVYAYEDGNLKEIALPGSEGTIVFGYGTGACTGKLETVTHGTESAEFSYFGALPAGVETSGELDATVSVGYDDFFRPTSFTYAGAAESYAYDKDDLVTSASGFSIARNASTGFPASMGDGTLLVTPSINGYGEVASLAYEVDETFKAGWALAIDDTGQITAKTEEVSGATTNYVYDYTDLGQLEEVVKNSSVFEEYDYDDNGNRTYQKVNGVERWLTYDDEDRIDEIYSNAAKTVQVAAYAYDVDGFLSTKTEGSDVTTYDYSSQGQLLEVVLPDTTEIEYLHDALGRRVAKVVDSTVTEKYLWAGMNQGLLAVYNSSDQLVVRYKYAGGRLPVSFSYNSATYYPVYDQVGSLRAIYDTSGTKVHEIIYDSFGNILSESGTFAGPVPHGYAGGLHDRDTGLVRFGYRDYDPKVGRWTAKDPIGFAGGDVSLYGYVVGNPVSLADPEGMGWYETILYHSGNFAAGFADSLTFGLTAGARNLTGAGGIVNKCSGTYIAGMYTEIGAELAVMGGSAALKRSIIGVNRRTARAAGEAYVQPLRRTGFHVHHNHPLFGHYGGGSTLFPTGGLPAWIHSNRFNLRVIPQELHPGVHARMARRERQFAAVAMNPSLTAGRAGRNVWSTCDCP